MRFPFFLFLLSLSLPSLPSSPLMSEARAVHLASSAASYTSNLFSAAELGQEQNIRKLVSKGVKIDSQEKGSGETALIKAVLFGNYSCASTLLKLGANPDKKTANQNTALMLAARRGQFTFVKLLLDFGADASILDQEKRTVVQIARDTNHDDIASYIIERFQKKYNSNSPTLTELEFTYLMLSDPMFLKAAQELYDQWAVVKSRIASTEEWRALVASQREWVTSGRNRIGAMVMDLEKTSKAMAFTVAVKLRYMWLCGQHINSAFMQKNERMYFEGINWHYTDDYIQASPKQYRKFTQDDHDYLMANNAEYARVDGDLSQQWTRVKSQIATPEESRALLESQRAWLKNGRDSVAARLMERENLDRVSAIISATKLRYHWLCGEKINNNFVEHSEHVYYEGASWHFSNDVFEARKQVPNSYDSYAAVQETPKSNAPFLASQESQQFDKNSPILTDKEYAYLLSSNPGFANAVHELEQQWTTMKNKISSPAEWAALTESQEHWRTEGRNKVAAKLMTQFNANKETAFVTATRMRHMWLCGKKIRPEFIENEEYLIFEGGIWHYSNAILQAEQKKNKQLEQAILAQVSSPESNQGNLQAEQNLKEKTMQAISEGSSFSQPSAKGNVASLKYNQELLLLASTNKQEEIRKVVLMYEADIDYKDPRTGETALMKALLVKQVETVKLLVSLGSNVNTVSNDKTMPLHIAARHGDLSSVKLLVAKGAKKDALDGNNQTALAIAQKCHHTDVIHFLTGKDDSPTEGVKNQEKGFSQEVLDF